MELLQQLEAWQKQAESAAPDSSADLDVAKRLILHGIEALAEISRLHECLKQANEIIKPLCLVLNQPLPKGE